MLRKIQILGVALLALFALSALVSASASAVLTFELALWLVNGADVLSELLVDATGELLFESLLNGADFDCSGELEGTIGPESLDLVTAVWDLELLKVIPELGADGTGILCTVLNICSSAEIWPVGLPWETEVERDVETGLFYELVFGAQYHIDCVVLGVLVEELCAVPAGGASTEVLNLAEDVELMEPAAEPESECNGNANDATVTALPSNLLLLIEGGTLSVSVP